MTASENKIIAVNSEHIEKGIEKYGGVVDEHLQKLIGQAGLQYTPYRFKDGRVLLVLPGNISAFLYPDVGSLYDHLDLKEY